MIPRWVMIVAVAATETTSGCVTDEDCSLSGVCTTSGACHCNAGWTGPQCSRLDRLPPASREAAAVMGFAPNLTSWGGNVVVDPTTGHHHLYAAVIAGPNGTSCGLSNWGSHSVVVKATSTTGVQGPYTNQSIAIGVFAHNPQAVLIKGRYVIFHIGAGSPPGSAISPCPTPPPPPCSVYTSASTCPPSRCSWTNGHCVPPPLPPTPPALCATQPAPPGYVCKGNTCGGPSPSSDHNCGAYLTVPTCSGGDCAATLSALCDKDTRCHSFSLENRYNGSGSLHSQTFSGDGSCLRLNPDWTTYIKQADTFKDNTFGRENTTYVGSRIHTSSSPDGPFEPLTTTWPGCNNPTPWVMTNGTIVVACTWHLYAAEELEGPWRSIGPISISPSTRMGVPGSWEDPFLFQDVNNHWHILSHTYTRQPGGPDVQNSISGHLFSRNVEGPWTVSPDEPYDNVVTYEDGTSETFATLERPKLFFSANNTPTHITNGVSPVWPCGGCTGFGDAPTTGGCCWCKVKPGIDWTYTLMQPLRTTSTPGVFRDNPRFEGASATAHTPRVTLQFLQTVEVPIDGQHGTKTSFEGGTVVRTDDGAVHLFTTDQTYGVVNTSLVYYRAPNSSATFSFVRQLVCCSTVKTDGSDPRASLWAPMPVYDDEAGLWHLFYVQYRSAQSNASGWFSNFGGEIAHARSSVSGPGGVGGPYVDIGVVLQPDNDSQPWEGLQGTDSISPPYKLSNGGWSAFYGSAHTEVPSTYDPPFPHGKWWNGIVTASALGDSFVRKQPSSLVNFNSGYSENPIVTWLPSPHNKYIAVFDDLRGQSTGFGFSWSADGVNWQTPSALVGVPTGARTPLGSMLEKDGTLTVYYTAYDNGVERVHRGQFKLVDL